MHPVTKDDLSRLVCDSIPPRHLSRFWRRHPIILPSWRCTPKGCIDRDACAFPRK